MPLPPGDRTGEGRLADNVIHFVRLLRGAGMRVGPAQAIGALEALQAAGVSGRDDFYWVLHASLVTRRADRPVFDQAFATFWQRRGLLEKMMQLLLPEAPSAPRQERRQAAALRVAQAFDRDGAPDPPRRRETEFDARATMSQREVLQGKDFEQMTAGEIAEAARLVRALVLPDERIATRRFRPHPRGRSIDTRATLRRAMRSGDLVELVRRAPREKPPPLVALIDISGSMSSYSRMMLHFMHALAHARPRVSTFLFGTRLTNITPHMAARDGDEALEKVSGAVEDWSGGTRIASSLLAFNRSWSRRVLAQGAVVLLVTDGLEREEGGMLGRQAERLAKSCRRLIWLNPLLRYDAFEARAGGIRALLPHVDEFRPVHNLESMASLAAALDSRAGAGADPRIWLGRDRAGSGAAAGVAAGVAAGGAAVGAPGQTGRHKEAGFERTAD